MKPRGISDDVPSLGGSFIGNQLYKLAVNIFTEKKELEIFQSRLFSRNELLTMTSILNHEFSEKFINSGTGWKDVFLSPGDNVRVFSTVKSICDVCDTHTHT